MAMAWPWHGHGMPWHAMAWHGHAMAWHDHWKTMIKGMFSDTYLSFWGNDCAVRQEIAVRSGLEESQTPKRRNILKIIKNSRSTAPAANMLIATS